MFITDLGFGVFDIEVVPGGLLVARRSAGVVLYDRTTGGVVATWSVADGSFALRIAIAPNGDAYITDADAPVLYRIPAAELRRPQAAEQVLPVFLEWPDPPVHYERGFINANGIVATPTASTCWSCTRRPANCSESGCRTSRSGRSTWAATA